MATKLVRTPFSRVWAIENGAGPANAPEYLALARAMGISWPQGDITPVYIPDPDRTDSFLTADTIRGQRGLPSLPLEIMYERDLSEILAIIRKGCALDIHIAIGACKDPSDFNAGWEKKIIIEGAMATDYSTTELGALTGDQNATVMETVAFTGRELYEIKTLAATELAGTQVTDEQVAIVICDTQTCGQCGIPSDGCSIIFAIAKASTGSPGLPAELIYSTDGGATFTSTVIPPMGLAEQPSDMLCVGTLLVVISNTGDAIYYAPIADVLAGTATWTKITTGIVAAGSPNALFSLGARATWIAADAGYIYFSTDITAGVTVQTAGTVTVQNLNDIHGFDDQNLVAVGASNAVALTRNGGVTWSAVTGPAVGVALNTVWMRGENEWFIGTAGGRLFYTLNAGVSWVEKAFPGSGAGQVREIAFSTPTIGYMAHDTAAPGGRILRTINGGNSWYIAPEAPATMPANDRINAMAACKDNPNLVFGAGLADNGTDGIVVKAA